MKFERSSAQCKIWNDISELFFASSELYLASHLDLISISSKLKEKFPRKYHLKIKDEMYYQI